MDEKEELAPILKIHDEFKEAIEGTAGKTIPGDELNNASAASTKSPSSVKGFQSQLRKRLAGAFAKVGQTPLAVIPEDQ